jgi:hypothetical protein
MGTDGKEERAVSETEFAAAYQPLAQLLPRSSACKHIPLKHLSGETFRSRLDEQLRLLLRKGVPSLWNSMRHFYHQPGKAEIIQELVLSYHKGLVADGRFPGASMQLKLNAN